MTREEYERHLDQLKGNARDIVEDLQSLLDDPETTYRKADEEYCSRLAERLKKLQFNLETLSMYFHMLNWRLEHQLED